MNYHACTRIDRCGLLRNNNDVLMYNLFSPAVCLCILDNRCTVCIRNPWAGARLDSSRVDCQKTTCSPHLHVLAPAAFRF
jgi:hypothetical protein